MRVLVPLFAILGMVMASWGLKEFSEEGAASGDLLKLCRDFRYQVSEELPEGGKHPLLLWLSSRPETLYALLTKLMDQPEQLAFVCDMFTVKFLESKDGLNQIHSVVNAMDAAEGSILDKPEVAKKRVRRDDEEESGSSGSTAEGGSQGGQQSNSFLFGRGRNPFSSLLSRGPGRTPMFPTGRPNLLSMMASPFLSRSRSPRIPNAFVSPTPTTAPSRTSLMSRYNLMKRYRLAAIARELWRRYLMARYFGVYKWPFYNPNAGGSGAGAGTGGNAGPTAGFSQGAPQGGFQSPPMSQPFYPGSNPLPPAPAMNQPYYTSQPGGMAPQPTQVSFQPMGSAPLPPQGMGTPGIMAPASGSAPTPPAGTDNPFLTSSANSLPYEDPFNLATNQNLPAFVSVEPLGNGQAVGSNMVSNDPFLFPTNVPSTPSGADPFLFSNGQPQPQTTGTPADTAADQQAAAELARFTEQYGPSFGPLMYILSKGSTSSPNTGGSAPAPPAPPSGAARFKREAVHDQAKLRRKRDDGLLGDPSDLLQIASMSSNPQATLRRLGQLQRQQAQNQISLLNGLLNPGQSSSPMGNALPSIGSSSSSSSSSFPGFGGITPTSPSFSSRGLSPFGMGSSGFRPGGLTPMSSGLYGGMRSPAMSSMSSMSPFPSMMSFRSSPTSFGRPGFGGIGGMASAFPARRMNPYANTLGGLGGSPLFGK